MFLELPAFIAKYCPAVWLTAADCHLRLFDRVVSQALAMCDGGGIQCSSICYLIVVHKEEKSQLTDS